jgi:hypothetical protein
MADTLKEVSQELRENNEVTIDVRENTNLTANYLGSVVKIFSTKLSELVDFMRGNQLDQLEARRESADEGEPQVSPAGDENYIQDIMEKIKGLVDDALGVAGLTVGVIAAPFVIIGSFFSELRVQTRVLNRFLGGGLGKIFSPITRFFNAIANSRVIQGITRVFNNTVKPFFSRIGQFFGLLDDAGKAAGGFGKILRTAATIGKTLGKIFYPITVLIGLFNAVTGFMDGYDEGGVLEGIKQGVIKAFDAIVGSFVRLIGSAASFIFDILGFDNFAASIKTQLNSVINGLYDSFGGIIDLIKGIFTLDFALITSSIKSIFSSLVDVVTSPFQLLYSAIQDLFSFVGIELPDFNIGQLIKDTAASAVNFLKKQFGFDGEGLPSIVDIVSGLYTLPYDLVRSVVAWIAGKLGFDQAEELLGSFSFSDILKSVVMAPLNLLSKAKDWLLSKFGLDPEEMPDPLDIITEIIKAPFNLLSDLRDWISERVSGLVSKFASFIPDPIKSLLGLNDEDEEGEQSRGMGGMALDAAGSVGSAVSDTASGVARGVGGFVSGLFGGDDEEEVSSGSTPARVATGNELQIEGEARRDAELERQAQAGGGSGGGNVNVATNVQNNSNTTTQTRPPAASQPDNMSDTMMTAGFAP